MSSLTCSQMRQALEQHKADYAHLYRELRIAKTLFKQTGTKEAQEIYQEAAYNLYKARYDDIGRNDNQGQFDL